MITRHRRKKYEKNVNNTYNWDLNFMRKRKKLIGFSKEVKRNEGICIQEYNGNNIHIR